MSMERLDRVRAQLERLQVDAVALVPGPNLRYLTGVSFHLLERLFLFILPREGEPVVVLPSLELPTWEAGAAFAAHLFGWHDSAGHAAALASAVEALPPIESLAVEHLRMRVMEFRTLQSVYPQARFSSAEDVLDPVRIRKDGAELEALRRAIAIAETALEEVVVEVSAGLSEREIANRLSAALLAHGGESVPIDPIVLSGPRSALPHGTAGARRVESGDYLLIDFGTTIRGYHSDITRTFIVGEAREKKQRAVYEAVRAANEAARAAVRPGVSCADVDAAARAVITAAGYGDAFIHRTGHGLGIDIHEAPSIAAGNSLELEPGMVFTIEPGIYLPDWGGVRVEDDVVVTAEGAESLTGFDRDLRFI